MVAVHSMYQITVSVTDPMTGESAERKAEVWCDMDTDGGGYTLLSVAQVLVSACVCACVCVCRCEFACVCENI